MKTTLENKAVHMEDGISIQNLPKTYRDSVVVCKELGINHLWIDSLCIIQNSSHDWSEQASRMAEIYQNAYVTIAAVAARNSTEGLFNDISDRLTSVSLPGYPWIQIRKQAQLPSASDDFMDPDFNDGHTLYKRGWTFQELSLSPRVIHYGRNEVVWQCQSRSICEGDPDGSIEISSLVSANLIREPDLSIEGLWYSIVGAYSWRGLTFEKDRLPAIAAFASRIEAENHQKKYVHGLWEDSLRLDLLWSVDTWKPDHHPGPSSGLEPRSLPTWSWVSVKAPVIWDNIPALNEFEEVPHTKIMKVAYKTRGPPLLGDAIEAHIVIQAPIFKLSDLRKTGTLSSLETVETNPNEVVWYSPRWDSPLDATTHGKQHTEALAIPLIMPKRKMKSKYARRFINSLVIERTSEVGKYRRVGVVELGLQAHATWSATDTESSEDEMTERGVEGERNYERFIQIMDHMEKRTITLI
ncbi:hypothetical protein yc1106_02231 [Curvularia clavata]|uniref:Heterokaryon incompatibility domain-containing protein n=1 Tax=Curvularia clavata TaxID=95742 RepID=A0A9Q8Z3B9_CURCL|nr:hypothetical protein yc1106_02231 [Curvularia clavata]